MNTEFEQRLRSDMERITQNVHVPPGLALTAYRHSRRRKMRARAVTAAGTVTVLAAGAVAAGVSGAFGSAGGRQARPPQIQTDAYVISRVERALAAPNIANELSYQRTVYPAGFTLQPLPFGLRGSFDRSSGAGSPWSVGYWLHWEYQGSMKAAAFTATGQHVFDEGITAGDGTQATTAVIYTSQTWWTASGGGGSDGNGPAPSSCVPGGTIALNGGTGNGWPAFIRSQLACGAYTVAGHQVVDGVDAIEITGNSGHIKLWVSPADYLPVRMTMGAGQTDFQWLPATPANLALLRVPVPAGFTQVSPPSP
jgi:hypothetical protein